MGEDTTARTLLDVFLTRVRTTPDADASRHMYGGNVVSTSWREWERRSRTLAAGLVALGLEPGDRVAILMRNRVEWLWIDMALVLAGAVSVPIFAPETPSGCAHVLSDSGARIAIVEDPVQLGKVMSVRGDVTRLERLVCVEAEAASVRVEDVVPEELRARVTSYEELRDLGEQRLETFPREFERRARAVRPETLASLAYTPGTAGPSKGVMLTHGNFAAASRALAAALPLTAADLQILYLPLAHVFGRISTIVAMEVGLCTACATSYRSILEDCRTFRPSILCTVPRLLEKVHHTSLAELGAREGLVGWLTNWVGVDSDGSLDVGDGLLDGLRRRLAERLVYARLRDHFGGQLRFIISAAARLQTDTARFFEAHKLPILEAFGLTETCAATTINRADDNRLGTVGKPLPGVEVALGDAGELLVRGPMVTPGYWHRPEDTAAAIDADGWLHTGDLFELDADGFYTLTERKRDIIFTATGEIVAPQPIEAALRADPLVDQVLIHGERRPFLTALITLDRDALATFATRAGIEGDHETLTRHATVYQHIEALFERVNETLSRHEQVQKFAILASGLTTETGELTAARGLRRRVAVEMHRALLDSFYQEQY